MPDWFDVFYIDKHSASAGKRVGFDREIFWKSGVSLSKHIVVEYIDREAGKKREEERDDGDGAEAADGVGDSRQSHVVAVERTTTKRRAGSLVQTKRVWSERRKGRKRQPGADSSDRPALTSTPTVERRRHRRRHWPTHDTTTKTTMTTGTTTTTTMSTTTTTMSTNARILLLLLASWHRHGGGGTVCVGRQAGERPSLTTPASSVRISFCTPTHMFALVLSAEFPDPGIRQ